MCDIFALCFGNLLIRIYHVSSWINHQIVAKMHQMQSLCGTNCDWINLYISPQFVHFSTICTFLYHLQGSTIVNDFYGSVNRTGLVIAGAALLGISGDSNCNLIDFLYQFSKIFQVLPSSMNLTPYQMLMEWRMESKVFRVSWMEWCQDSRLYWLLILIELIDWLIWVFSFRVP